METFCTFWCEIQIQVCRRLLCVPVVVVIVGRVISAAGSVVHCLVGSVGLGAFGGVLEEGVDAVGV